MVLLTIDGTFVSLQCVSPAFDKRRKLDAAELGDIGRRYAVLRERPDAAHLLGLGRDLYRWLDGPGGWLSALQPKLEPPFVLEVRASGPVDDVARAVLQAPWELLADHAGFLAANDTLRFAPVRRLGSPRDGPALDDYRLAVAFMASAPRGGIELDYEAEETAILTAARHGLDLLVEDSGDPEELGRRLSALRSAPPVLHLSCHGHNAWKATADAAPHPVLMMEQATGAERPTPAADLVSALRPYTPRLLFLSACLSAAAGGEGGSAAMSGSLAGSLIRAGIPAVLGWDGSVADAAATAFAHVLYDGLARRQSVVEAAASARLALLRRQDAGSGSSTGKDIQGALSSGLDVQVTAARDALRRDWHLARVWLGAEGGGPVVGGTRRRSLLPPDHGQKLILARKKDDALAVADPAMFVGRRRELQSALRRLADPERAGLLLHGLGRVGKSSLAARISNRRPDLRLAVVYGDYDALSVLAALAEALKAHAPARQLLAGGRVAVQADAIALEAVLIDLLTGPCREAAAGDQPVLLLIDDLERILQADPDGGRHRIRAAEQPVLQAVLRAFDPNLSESRLLLTSRFPFTLWDDEGQELAERLHEQPLSRFAAGAQRKLSLRQVTAARTRTGTGTRLDDAGLAARLPLLTRAEELACGNPGLQDLIGDRLVLRPAVGVEHTAAVLDQMAAYLHGGDLPDDEQVRYFLQNLAMDALLQQATAAGQALLRAALLFAIPVPTAVIDTLAETLGGSVGHLRDLGLLEPFENVVNHQVTALAVNDLAAGRLTRLTQAETAALANLVLPSLFEAWGGRLGAAARPYSADIVLTRLGLLVETAEVVSACATNAVDGLLDQQVKEAAALGQASIVLLEHQGNQSPLRLLSQTSKALRTIGDGASAAALLAKGETRLAEAERELDPDQLSSFLFTLGRHQAATGLIDAALTTFERLCALERGRGNDHQLAVARGDIADILQARGELGEALRIRREETLPVYTRLGDVRSVAVTQGKIADILQARGELDEALRIRREDELPVYTRLGDVRSVAVTQGKIANLLAQEGNFDDALKLQLERLAVNKGLGNLEGIAATLWDIVRIELAQDQPDQALPRLAEAWSLLLKLGRADGLAVVGKMFGQLLAAIDMKIEAADVLGQSAAAYRKLWLAVEADAVEQMIAGLG